MEEIAGKLARLYDEYAKAFPNEELVFGDGNPRTGIMMVGEAPGKDEVRLGKPFVGMAGGNLGRFMEYLGLSRDNIYVTNAIKYRLYRINPTTGRKSNRPSRNSEIAASMSYLKREIEMVNARLVITLGNVPLRAVTGNFSLNIGNEHGKIMDADGIRVIPLYHPASLIYNRNLEETYYRDLDKLKIIISEVQ
jgi:DNA polymerase